MEDRGLRPGQKRTPGRSRGVPSGCRLSRQMRRCRECVHLKIQLHHAYLAGHFLVARKSQERKDHKQESAPRPRPRRKGEDPMSVLRSRFLPCAIGAGMLIASIAIWVDSSAGAVAAGGAIRLPKSAIGEQMAPRLSATTAPLAKPAGYKVVKAGPFNSPGGAQTMGEAICPGTEVPVSGGAVTSPAGSNDPAFYATINSSYPFKHDWVVYVNTSSSSGADADFEVYAVCVDKVSSYTIVSSGAVDNPAGSSTLATATCPSNLALLGGGATSASSSVNVSLGVDAPTSNSWRAVQNNGSTSDSSINAYAICETQPSGYSEPSAGAIAEIPNGAVSPGTVDCPSGTLPLSGGNFNGTVMGLDLGSTFPAGYDWVVFMNNGSGGSQPEVTIAVCAS